MYFYEKKIMSESSFSTGSESFFEKKPENDSVEKNSNVKFKDLVHLKNGAMGDIYKGADNLGRKIILKRIKEKYKNDKNYINLFQKEFEILFHLKNEGIVKVFDKGVDEKGNFYSMEFINGKTLTKVIESKKLKNDFSFFEKIFEKLLNAISYIHKEQVYHRDLKPDNIMITAKGNNIKILDFGLAKSDIYKKDNLNKAGTKGYMSPEQENGKNEIDQRSDIYSLGIILLEIFTKSKEKYNIKKIKKTTYKEIIRKCTEEKPKNRFYDCDAIEFFIKNLYEANKKFDEGSFFAAKKLYKKYIKSDKEADLIFVEKQIDICKKKINKKYILYIMILMVFLIIYNIYLLI